MKYQKTMLKFNKNILIEKKSRFKKICPSHHLNIIYEN
jgi:hypothetical protein